MSQRLNIREDLEVEINPNTVKKVQVSESKKDDKAGKELPEKITTIVEAIHAGMTKNYTFYPAQNLEKSVGSWTKPYNKPVIKNHDIHEEPVGRVVDAEFRSSSIVADKQTIQLTLEITDPETIRKVLDGRYQTLSIGGSTSSAICSACGKDLVKEGFCGHYKGRTYEGKKAHWIIGEMEFDEISWVNVPADANAQVIQKNADTSIKESAEGGESMPTNEEKHVEEHTEDILDQIDQLRENADKGEEDPETTDATVTEEEDADTETKVEEGEENPEKQTEDEDKTEEPTIEEQLQTANDKVETLESEVETLKTDKATLEDKVTTLEDENKKLQDKVTELEGDVATTESETRKLLKQNISLATAAHRTLAESVVNLQVALGKTKEDEVEELYESLSKESARTLKEQVSELIKEKPQRIIQTIDRPTGEEDGDTTDSTHQEESKQLTIVDLAERLDKVFNKQNNY